MNSVLATLRATLRLKGSLLFWSFYLFLGVVSMAIGHFDKDGKAILVGMFVLTFASWMGWLLFLSRLWQLQRHAESLALPGARRRGEAAAGLLAFVGVITPTVLLASVGAPFFGSLLLQLLAASTALVYLMVTPLLGVLLLLFATLLPLFFQGVVTEVLGELPQIYLIGSTMVLVFAAVGLYRWRRVMQFGDSVGWNVPQVLGMIDGGLSSTNGQRDPAMQWLGDGPTRLPASIGPSRRISALAVLICGPLAPLGWRSYLRSSAWMLLAVALLAVFAFSGEREARGPAIGLIMLISVWAAAIPLTLVTRLRQEWLGEGHAIAEAALLPGLAAAHSGWWQVHAALAYTTVYRLSLPIALATAALWWRSGDLFSALLPLLIGAWALLLVGLLLPLARRRSNVAGFLLYSMVGVVTIGVLLAHFTAQTAGPWPEPRVLFSVSAIVAVVGLLGWALPAVRGPLVRP